jgi:hypothetical protein
VLHYAIIPEPAQMVQPPRRKVSALPTHCLADVDKPYMQTDLQHVLEVCLALPYEVPDYAFKFIFLKQSKLVTLIQVSQFRTLFIVLSLI